MRRSNRESARTLFSTAISQGGYFTAKQAREAGYGYPHLDYHVAAGNFERVDHGLYRLTTIPPGEHDEFRRLALWSRNRKGQPQAIVSHESALVLHDLSELLPTAIHLTVPSSFRKPPPRGCVLHKASLPSSDVEEREGFLATTPLRTLVDASLGDVSTEQLEKAVTEAIARGLVRRGKLLEAAERIRPAKKLRLVLGEPSGEGIER
jgi:predicted transcriptional regulator of viral defense system